MLKLMYKPCKKAKGFLTICKRKCKGCKFPIFIEKESKENEK